MKNLIYTSEISPQESDSKQMLKDIIKEAVRFNDKHDITGILLFHDGVFLQVLEGDEKAVDDLYVMINNDNRHKNLKLLHEGSIGQRNFPNWRMKLLNIPNDSRFSDKTIAKVKKIYSHNFKFNANDFLVVLQSLLNDDEFVSQISK